MSKNTKSQPESKSLPLDILDGELKGRTVMGEAERTALCLWIAHTYAYSRFKHTPRLFLTSVGPGCGKSETLKLVATASCNGKKFEAGTTLAVIRDFKRDIAVNGTCVMDQLDGMGKTSTDDFKLMNLFCSSTEVGATIGIKQETTETQGKKQVRTYKTVAIDVGYPMAMGKIGSLPNDALLSRCITIHMQPETPEEREAQMAARNKPFPDLRGDFQEWLGGLQSVYKKAPKGTQSRVEDMWQPLLNVADYAGGKWPERAREALSDLHDDQGGQMPREVALLKTIFDRTRNWKRKDITGPELTTLLGSDTEYGDRQRGRILSTVFGIRSKKRDGERFIQLADVEDQARRHRLM